MKANDRDNKEEFNKHYEAIYGERWPRLKEALRQIGAKIQLQSPFAVLPEEPYELDPASLFVARQLGVQSGDQVLDLCAAPGGKSLCLLYLSRGEIELTCNELSAERFKRLKRVLRQHLPEEVFQRVRTTHRDGQRWGLHHAEVYDRVLLDAPCSGERHLLENEKELKVWTPKRSKGLHHRQVALLCAAFDSLKPGGTLVYSTCSLNPLENDKTVEVLLKKRSTARHLEINVEDEIDGEVTEWGFQIFPMKQGWGPMYCAKIFKTLG